MKSLRKKVSLHVNVYYFTLTRITVPFVVEDELFDDVRPPEFTVKYLERAANEIEADEARLLAESVSVRAGPNALGDADGGCTWWVVPVHVSFFFVMYLNRLSNYPTGRKGRHDGQADEGGIAGLLERCRDAVG